MTDKTREDVVETMAKALADLDARVYGLPAWAVTPEDQQQYRRQQACAALAALNTRLDLEVDMRERCAQVAESWRDPCLATDHENRTYADIATTIRSLPLSNEGESRDG